ncbi:DUF308 domain-containing protein [Schaalia sp. 19OD2882]|uniref:HdeD family acid-resistance protein n=1 Tax=Schaalia sp. 19OD2882 TaxID=2794089 RepID=UPI001C1E900E|nr:DUF308 domain-containing protein [Schaalia sp. 19OD2882]QWW20212.1 DUF308 domain-containing protein [Schaalia sp. 19OD2882]
MGSSSLEGMVGRSSTALITMGVLGVLWGLVLALWPGVSAMTFAIIWGAYALMDGISSLVMAFRDRSARGWYLVSGILGSIAGVAVMASPGIGLAVSAWILGIFLLARGVTELVTAFAPKAMVDKVLLALGGVLWFLAGLVVLANPAEALLTLTWLLGLMAVAWGITLVVAGFRVRSMAKQSPEVA